MYVPPHYARADLPTLHAFIDEHPFGLLVSQGDGVPVATHLPFLLDRTAGPHGTLVGHLARDNQQWKQLGDRPVLAVFSGPHAYISPSWYQSPKTVPTWNYVAVHAYGPGQLIEDPDELIALLGDLTARFEGGRPVPWTFDAADPFIRKVAAQVVGFRIAVERLEGKWKLNQNHPVERRRRVIAALREKGGDDALGVADLMAAMLGE